MRNFKSIREIFDYAIEREAEAHVFYKQMAPRMEKAEVRKALENFSLDEYQHKIRLEAFRDKEVEPCIEEVGNLYLADSIEDVKPYAEMSYTELLAYAIRKENEAFRLYEEAAGLSKRKDVKELFLLLRQEEAQHKLKLEVEYDLATFEPR